MTQRKDPGKNQNRFLKRTKTLAPDKHQNRLLGEALTLKINILLSEVGITPRGFENLMISDEASPWYGKTLDSLSSHADEYLTYCTVASMPTVTADDIADMMAQVNSAFDGDLDTTGWSCCKIALTGEKAVAEVGFLKRIPGLVPHIIPDLSGDYIQENIAEGFELMQNYPNPFNPTTTIQFSLPEDGLVTIGIYNVLGQQVATLISSEEFSTGLNGVTFNAQDLASGLYLYRISVHNPESGSIVYQDVKRMLMVK